jgi:hypothetical protein
MARLNGSHACVSFQKLLDKLTAEGKAPSVLPPPVTIDLLLKVLQSAWSSVSQDWLQIYETL